MVNVSAKFPAPRVSSSAGNGRGKHADGHLNDRLNGNTIPITTWAMVELIKDPELFRDVREEIDTVYTIDPETGSRCINARKLVNLPLMQSLYVELMRTHVSFNITREATQPLVIAGYPIEKGALVQVCSRIEHYAENVWGVEGHPASEFWAYRHVKYVDEPQQPRHKVSAGSTEGSKLKNRQFVMKGRPSSFLPFGGYFQNTFRRIEMYWPLWYPSPGLSPGVTLYAEVRSADERRYRWRICHVSRSTICETGDSSRHRCLGPEVRH